MKLFAAIEVVLEHQHTRILKWGDASITQHNLPRRITTFFMEPSVSEIIRWWRMGRTGEGLPESVIEIRFHAILPRGSGLASAGTVDRVWPTEF